MDGNFDDDANFFPAVPGAVIEPEEEEMLEDPVGPVRNKYEAESFRSPLKVGSKEKTRRVFHTIYGYKSMSDAMNKVHPHQEVHPDNYYVYKELPNGMVNLTKKLGVYGIWVNPEDLKQLPPEHYEWRKLQHYTEARYYLAKREAPIIDLEGQLAPLKILYRQPILIVGIFKGPDGKIYAAPDETYRLNQWYGLSPEHIIPIDPPPLPEPDVDAAGFNNVIYQGEPVYTPEPTFGDKLAVILRIGIKNIKEFVRSFSP